MARAPFGATSPFPYPRPLAKGRASIPNGVKGQRMKLISGNSNLPLARAVADYLELPLADTSVRRFADEEVFVEIHENVRSEERRVGKEWVSTCGSRWTAYH